MGAFFCADTRGSEKSEPLDPVKQSGASPVMLQLSTSQGHRERDGNVDSSVEQLTFWVNRGTPGFYEICWNPALSPTTDPAEYSEYLGTLEVLPVLSVVGKPCDVAVCFVHVTRTFC